ncbi:ANTH domain-containing protein [Phakopsora pachyrhizi]|uniref:ANTH domain-domain-containing protein n=1 Tax=Phakopsora pachyrhizi TaxID=170000 RepID=A0AAV0B6L2_PHAPC|nr:ANTH domain-containing protein [Phakopsora pachyrhizi]CAH7677196.1 ANTH domain-domain-containing protein [Phakopsora pachyrhizi]
MSGHWNKIVNGACKPKHVPPKSKYIDALVSSTHQLDGSFQDVSRILKSKLRDPNSSVVFKALLVIHTLIRVGNSDEVMNYWSGLDGRDGRSLGLKDVCATSDTPQNLSRYSNYLLARVKCYAAIKHDPIRTRSEAPASLRSSNMNGNNRLRTLTVEKGLLREVGTLQKLMDALVDCKFYLEDTDDDLVMSALRLLVKDLLILFQAVNEGVINVLEHYFEMSHVDATTALKTYKIFCKQCEKVVSYLGVAKKLERIIHVNIPNLRHAPVSLAGSLEEYLNDPNFETNRQEYKENKRIADGKGPSKENSTPKPITSTSTTSNEKKSSQPADGQKAFIDFFESIETEQQSMFNPNSLSPNTTYFQQQANLNPLVSQPTGFNDPNLVISHPTGIYPFNNQAPNSNLARASMGQALFGTLNGTQPMQPQATGFAPGGQLPLNSHLQMQPTGINPFRQSIFNPSDGMASFPLQQQQQLPIVPQATGVNNPFSQFTNSTLLGASNNNQDLTTPWNNQVGGSIDRSTGAMSAPPISTQPTGPLGFSDSPFSAGETKPLRAQQTGSRNPFAAPPGSIPAIPKLPDAPSLNQLAASAFSVSMVQQRAREQAAQLQFKQQQQKQAQQNLDLSSSTLKDQAEKFKKEAEEEEERKKKKEFQDFFSKQLNRLEGGGKDLEGAAKNPMGSSGLFENVASEFAVTKNVTLSSNSNQLGSGGGGGVDLMGGDASVSSFGGNLLTQQPTEFLQGGVTGSIGVQKTGFGGSSVKPFQPSSSFGTSLVSHVTGMPTNNSLNVPITTSSNSTTTPSPLMMSTTGLPSFSSGNGGGIDMVGGGVYNLSISSNENKTFGNISSNNNQSSLI